MFCNSEDGVSQWIWRRQPSLKGSLPPGHNLTPSLASSTVNSLWLCEILPILPILIIILQILIIILQILQNLPILITILQILPILIIILQILQILVTVLQILTRICRVTALPSD